MKNLKSKKTGSLFVREISSIILEDVKDPHIKFITITDCDVSNDLLSLLDKFISISDLIPLFFLPKILF